MRLSSLVLENFKAFRRAEIAIRSTTVIAGPNSVGKSSVLEAIRFLFGAAPELSNRWDWIDLAHHPFRPTGEDHPIELVADEPVLVTGVLEDLSDRERARFEPVLTDGRLLIGARALDYERGDGEHEGPFYLVDPSSPAAKLSSLDRTWDSGRKPWRRGRHVWRHADSGVLGDIPVLAPPDAPRLPGVISMARPTSGGLDFTGLLQPAIEAAAKRVVSNLGERVTELVTNAINAEVDALADRWSATAESYLGPGSRIAIKRRHLLATDLMERAIASMVPTVDVWAAQPRFGAPPLWDPHEDELPPASEPLGDVGDGMRRMIALAALEVLAVDSNKPVLLLVEEPETGLHPAAQRRVAVGLRSLQANPLVQTVVVTHSPSILRAASDGGIVVVRGIASEDDAWAESISSSDLRLATDAIGVSPADILTTTRVVVVEGELDQAAFTSWAGRLGFDLTGDGTVLHPARGASRADLVVELTRIVNPSATIAVLLDGGPGPERERDLILRRTKDRVAVYLLPVTEVEAAVSSAALARWLLGQGREHDAVERAVQTFERGVGRGKAKEGLSLAVAQALGRPYGGSDFISVAQGMEEHEIPSEIKSILVSVLS